MYSISLNCIIFVRPSLASFALPHQRPLFLDTNLYTSCQVITKMSCIFGYKDSSLFASPYDFSTCMDTLLQMHHHANLPYSTDTLPFWLALKEGLALAQILVDLVWDIKLTGLTTNAVFTNFIAWNALKVRTNQLNFSLSGYFILQRKRGRALLWCLPAGHSLNYITTVIWH